jgi:excisionase family DNA binding protein
MAHAQAKGARKAPTPDARRRRIDEAEFRFEAGGEPLLFTITAAAKRLGCSRTTLHALLDRGELGYTRLLGGDRRVPAAELQRWIERNLVKANER